MPKGAHDPLGAAPIPVGQVHKVVNLAIDEPPHNVLGLDNCVAQRIAPAKPAHDTLVRAAAECRFAPRSSRPRSTGCTHTCGALGSSRPLASRWSARCRLDAQPCWRARRARPLQHRHRILKVHAVDQHLDGLRQVQSVALVQQVQQAAVEVARQHQVDRLEMSMPWPLPRAATVVRTRAGNGFAAESARAVRAR